MNLFDLLRGRSTSTTDTTLGFGSIDDMLADLPPQLREMIKRDFGDLLDGAIVIDATIGVEGPGLDRLRRAIYEDAISSAPPSAIQPWVLEHSAEVERLAAMVSQREVAIHHAKADVATAQARVNAKHVLWHEQNPDAHHDTMPDDFIAVERLALTTATEKYQDLVRDLDRFITEQNDRLAVMFDEGMAREAERQGQTPWWTDESAASAEGSMGDEHLSPRSDVDQGAPTTSA